MTRAELRQRVNDLAGSEWQGAALRANQDGDLHVEEKCRLAAAALGIAVWRITWDLATHTVMVDDRDLPP